MSEPIPYGRHWITDEDIDAVIDVLKSDYLTQGPEAGRFEEAFASYTGANYAVSVSSGTAALHLSALALGLENGDKVITTPLTFAASANSIRYCEAGVVFSDIDPETGLLDIEGVRDLVKNSPEGTYKGIIPVDFAGRAVDLEPFRQLADDYGLWILEDACHAPGGYFTDSKGIEQRCGNGLNADLTIFSFHPVKHIAAGEGGMVTTNNENLYRKLLRLRTHGIIRESSEFLNPVSIAVGESSTGQTVYPDWYMEMQELGYNYRLTDIQAALGLSQLSRADLGIARRREIAAFYEKSFKDKKFIIRRPEVVSGHAWHLYIIEVENRLGLYQELRRNNIFPQIHYLPLHLMPYYQQFGWKLGDFPHAEEYYRKCISLPIFPTLSEDDQIRVIECIDRYYA